MENIWTGILSGSSATYRAGSILRREGRGGMGGRKTQRGIPTYDNKMIYRVLTLKTKKGKYREGSAGMS